MIRPYCPVKLWSLTTAQQMIQRKCFHASLRFTSFGLAIGGWQRLGILAYKQVLRDTRYFWMPMIGFNLLQFRSVLTHIGLTLASLWHTALIVALMSTASRSVG